MTARSGRPGCAEFTGYLVLVLSVAACQPQSPAFPVAPTRVIDIGRVVTAFKDICLATAPTFGQARQRFARNDLTSEREDGVVYDLTGTMSVRVDGVATGRGRKIRCSIVYEDPNRIIAAERIDAMIWSERRRASGKRRAQFPTADGRARDGRAWRYTISGRIGELFDVPHSGRPDLGVLILQFPAPD